jgi:hypothetical protein
MRIFHYLIVAYATILPLAMELIRLLPSRKQICAKIFFPGFFRTFQAPDSKENSSSLTVKM